MGIPNIVYEPVGSCIYCGATENLTREHIVPRGLKGTLILPDASCRDCATITGRIENLCLRHMMGRFRRRIGIKSKKAQPASLPLKITMADGSEEERSVPISDLPTAISLPVWHHEPTLLTGVRRPFEVATWTWIKKDAPAAVERLGGVGFEVTRLQPVIFSRMLAKIAFSYSVAKLGLGTFEPLLIQHILVGLENPTHLVGGPPQKPPAEKALHRLTPHHVAAHEKSYLVIEVRLLAQLGAPTYMVVVGEL
jgi:hypothetical protein